MTALSAAASQQKENILNEIQIDALKSTYNITLNTTLDTDVKRTIQSSDNMILTLKNVKPAKSLNTVYKNAVEVDSIMVEPVGESNLNIIIKAKNISNSAINVESEDTTETLSTKSVITPKKQKKSNKESIVLAAPVDSYQPVYHEDDELVDEDNSVMAYGLIAKIKNILSQDKVSNIVTTGLIGIILFCGIKLFKREEQETAIGLAKSLKEKDVDLYQELANRQAAITSSSQKSSYTKSAVVSPISKPSVNINSGYGLRAYKSSSRNPYMSADNTMLSKTMPQTEVSRPQAAAMSTVGSRVNVSAQNLGINRPTQSFGNATTPSNIDSMKFLESMTKIYEKNGRSDLAQGLKAGMLKAKTNF